MTKTQCPERCGKKFISTECAEKHADAAHPGWRDPKVPRSKGWATPYGFIDFEEPVTYEEALTVSKIFHDEFKGKTA